MNYATLRKNAGKNSADSNHGDRPRTPRLHAAPSLQGGDLVRSGVQPPKAVASNPHLSLPERIQRKVKTDAHEEASGPGRAIASTAHPKPQTAPLPVLQRKPEMHGHDESSSSGGGCSCGGTCAACSDKQIQRKGESEAPDPSSGFHSALDRSGSGTPLDPHALRMMEGRFGEKFDEVRIHSDTAAADAARHIRAHAFTTGRDIYFGQGRYEPRSNSGQKLIAHELTHVLQQRRGIVSPGLKPLNAVQSDGLEREAEQAEAHVERPHSAADHPIARSLDSLTGSTPTQAESSNEKRVQRKCACGGTCSDCSGKHGELTSPAVQRKDDALESEAHGAAHDIAQGHKVSSKKFSSAEPQSVQALDWEWCNPFSDPDCGFRSTVGVAAGEASEIASEVWDAAKRLANAVGGILTYINNLLTITIPPKRVCNAHSLQLSLPEIGTNLPFLEGMVPIGGDVFLYGEAGLHLGVVPELNLQLGPCLTHTITIALHPLSLSGEASGGFDLTIAGGIGAEARAAIYGEVGVKILWPDPPLLIQLPVVNLQAGLAGFFRGMIADHMSVDVSASAGITGFSFSASKADDIGFALDLGLAGYGALTVFGLNLCTLYFPLFKTHKDAVVSLGLGFGLDVGAGSMGLGIDASAKLNSMKWDDLGIKIQRDMFKQDCPLCQLLRALGLMPSNFGGTWRGPGAAWPMGPLHPVFHRNPGLYSKALCRGACGADCETCKEEKEHPECVDTGTGCHEWWVYPNYDICNTHSGCRNHDGCYDWCSDKTGFRGKGIYISPCHRWCDFECICDYNLPQCIGWIGGKPPYDGQLVFSDMPYKKPGCSGPCPPKGKASSARSRVCLPTITVIGHRNIFHKGFHHSTGDITIFSTPLEIPYIPPPTLDVFVRGEVDAGVNAGLGPVTLEGLCLIFDPATYSYMGTGSLHLKGDLNGFLKLTGIVGAKAGWGCLLNAIDLEVLRGEAGLSATGLANIPLDLSATASVSCHDGKLMLVVDTLFKPCLDLKFKLDALLRVLLFKRFEIFNGKWNLVDRSWGRCWDIPIDVTKGVISSAGCGSGGATGAPGLTAPGGPPSLGAGGAGAGPAPASPGVAASHAELGKVDTLSIKTLVSDLFKLATQSEVIHDKKHGGLPADPAKEAGKENPCGDVKPDDKCGTKELPLTHVTFAPGPLGQGGTVKASPLTKCQGNTEGSEPDNSIYKAQFDCINAAGEKGFWVRAHLLHGKTSSSGSRNLHGPGDDVRNLIIADKSLNVNMSNGAEKPALDRVYDSSEVLWYESKVDSYVSGLDFFSQSITVNFGSFDTNTGTEGPRLGGGTFGLKRKPPNCPAGGGGLVVPPGALGGPTDECADPLNIPEFDVTLDGKKRTVKTKDAKHTRMAKKTLDRILEVAKQVPNCTDPALSQCEQDFCAAVGRTDKKSYGGQIDSPTRVDDAYKQLLVDAWKGKKPPSSGEWTEFGSADSDVGFDMDSKAATTEYTVHTNVTTGGKLLTGTHLFPGA